MDEIYEIINFLPINSQNLLFVEFTSHHFGHLEKCIDNKMYSSAFMHIHILYMSFIYSQLFRISNTMKEEFKYSWIGLPNDEKDFLNSNDSLFAFSGLREKTAFRFFRLVGFDDGTIGQISACVNSRNDHMHAGGKILINDEKEFSKQIIEYLTNMKKIIQLQDKQLHKFYDETINVNDEWKELEYKITYDDIELNFLIPYLISKYEIQEILKWKTKDKFSNALAEYFE